MPLEANGTPAHKVKYCFVWDKFHVLCDCEMWSLNLREHEFSACFRESSVENIWPRERGSGRRTEKLQNLEPHKLYYSPTIRIIKLRDT
jgi:hypothetical protein